ncbi:MAG: ribonuclease III [Peptoclostridium sp.]|uniref:ribonuclease III n=1 Tax=Peptoclostridium sp. TaxID=1904860 RepID=UPI00139F0DE7|nr:ribonuclease III [Peptoclostridium sp.]MZQ75573.1 ribonuclease III [Peptoclostridium sp.]
MSAKSEVLDRFEKAIGYEFSDKRLLAEALVHSSYANENRHKGRVCNERLEFLGDSVLGIVVSDYLFKNTELPEGELTKKRAAIVCEKSLSDAGNKIGLGGYLFLGKGEEATGGRERASILADAFEAVIGAIYLDSGIYEASIFIIRLLEETIKGSIEGRIFRDHKTELQEILQGIGSGEKIKYELVSESGPDHNKKFVMEVKFGDRSLGAGEGKTKKEAEQEAAKVAIERFV